MDMDKNCHPYHQSSHQTSLRLVVRQLQRRGNSLFPYGQSSDHLSLNMGVQNLMKHFLKSLIPYNQFSQFPPNKSETNSSFSAHKNSYSRSIQSYFPAYKSSSEISSTKSKSLTSKESSFSYEVSPATATNTRLPTPPLPPLLKTHIPFFQSSHQKGR